MSSLAVQPTYNFDAGFERAVVYYCVTSRRFFDTVGFAVVVDAISGDARSPQRLALQAARDLARELGHGPGSTALVMQFLRRLKSEGKICLDDIDTVYDYLDEASRNLPDESALTKALSVIVRRHVEWAALNEAYEAHCHKSDIEPSMRKLQAAQSIGKVEHTTGSQLGKHSFGEMDKLRRAERLSTGIYELDRRLMGGLKSGEIGVFVAKSGGGKSMALNQVLCAGLRRKMTCVLASLELPVPMQEMRMMSALTGVPLGMLESGHTDEAYRRYEVLEPTLGQVFSLAFTPHDTRVADIHDFVKRVEDRTGKRVDLLDVDYADKLSGTRDNEYENMRDVYEHLRLLAAEGVVRWVWTASQSTRAKSKNDILDIESVADSIHKVRVSDLVVTINPIVDGTKALEAATRVNLWVAKNRTGVSQAKAGPLELDFEHGVLAKQEALIVDVTANANNWSEVDEALYTLEWLKNNDF